MKLQRNSHRETVKRFRKTFYKSTFHSSWLEKYLDLTYNKHGKIIFKLSFSQFFINKKWFQINF